MTSPETKVRLQAFAGILPDMSAGKRDTMLSAPVLARTFWSEIVKTADANYTPGLIAVKVGGCSPAENWHSRFISE